ncbi:hypothetical protein KY290_008076 [Solanum tuberosum]|uniref:Uncharacterized protein n=1 Tax=Solanum tuberosum TaxID=4113 RepID=A0ABQ7W7F3_SOLTU|nr:hypothetical protein KY290_008076 [Solanum tuberosum]
MSQEKKTVFINVSESVLWKVIASSPMARGEATLHRLLAMWCYHLQKAMPGDNVALLDCDCDSNQST